MPWYLGRPGSIIQLPAPSRGTQTPYERLGATHQLLSGGRVRDSFGVKRSWQFTWQALTRDQIGILDGFAYASGGPGTYVLFDPEQRNLLDPNVASTTSVTGDLTGFAFAGDPHFNIFATTGGSWFPGVGGPFPAYSQGTVGVSVFASAPASTQILSTITRPVIAGASYTVSAYIANHTTTTGIQVRINWYDSAFTWTATTAGSTVAGSVTGRSVGTGVAPAGTYYARIDFASTSANTSGGTQTVDLAGIQLEQASSVSAWVPGPGVPYVTVDSGGRGRQQTNQNDYTLTLVEV